MLEILGDTLEKDAIIANAFRLERVVGEGGMGVVWASRELSSGRAVALKFLRAGYESDPRNQQRFLREARAAMGIAHPHVARVEAVLETESGAPFLVMDLLEGESLRTLLQRRGTLTPVEMAKLLVPVVDAVHAAHASGIVHRDLKPENVFLVGGQHVRVLDFGIAKQMLGHAETNAPSLTSTGALLGTPVYMAPEQIFGEGDIDARADIWSLGIMIYECLAGRRPTDGDGFGPIIKRITSDPLLPLAHARLGLPPQLTSLVDRMISRPRGERPTLVEVRALLVAIAAGYALGPSHSVQSPYAQSLMAPSPVAYSLGGSTNDGLVRGTGTGASPTPSPRTGSSSSSSTLMAIGIGVAALAVVGAIAGTAIFLRSRDGVAGITTTTGGANGAPVFGPTPAVKKVIDAATEAQARKDGKTCLAKLDELDKMPTGMPNGVPSTDPRSGYGGMRAICTMTIRGRCEEGKKMYRAFIVRFSPDGTNPDPSVKAMADVNCLP